MSSSGSVPGIDSEILVVAVVVVVAVTGAVAAIVGGIVAVVVAVVGMVAERVGQQDNVDVSVGETGTEIGRDDEMSEEDKSVELVR